MVEILISSQTYNKREFRKVCGESLEELQCSGQQGVMWSYEPYTIGRTTREEMDIMRVISLGNPRNIHELSSTLGQDNIAGVSDAMVMLRDTTAAMSGSTATIHAARANEFILSVKHCQDTLLTYRNIARTGGAAGSAKASAGHAIHSAFENMQKKFQHELRITALGQKKPPRKGTPLTNSTRAMRIARSSRRIEKIQLVSKVQASALGRFSSYGKVLGNGLVVIDFGSRIGNLHNTYKEDGDWERELFIESSSFAASGVMGLIAAKVGTAALTFFVVATPVGWVGLIVTVAALSIGTNYLVKDNASSWYDEIMDWVNSW